MSDGFELAYRLWRPATEARGLVVALHGIQSHSGWYGASSSFLAEAGYVVAFLDRRGSGVNTWKRGDASHVDRLVHDVVQAQSHLARHGFANMPKILLAISWGGKLASLIAARRPELFDGLALLAPGLCTHMRANAVQQAALKFADAAGFGDREIAIPLDDPSLFADDPAYQEFIRSDPLTLRRVTVRFLRISLDIDDEIHRSSSRIHCPTLLMLAKRDRIIDNDATRRLVESFGSPCKTVLEYPDACHTFEFEKDREPILKDLASWLDTTTQVARKGMRA
ncbi:MAG: lysophospholipase [Planctomycetota bacterium]|nr:alpha/beta fold hydrolase [Planctomycetaceae bacterium]MDQ3332155.1 lysophospholipase [Planctomycetota bacterium]